MRDFTYTNYIPDLTERFPEGFRTFDEPYDYGYEPSYEELVADGEYSDKEEQPSACLRGREVHVNS